VTKWLYVLAAVGIGGLIALQPAMNAELAKRIGSPFGAGVLSIFVSFALVVAIFLGSRQPFAVSAVPSLPFYLWFGGAIGVVFVVGTLWLAPKLGAALLFAAIVAGQLIVATIADFRGFGGLEAETFSPWKIVGIVLVVAGVVAFQRA
jgi:transporter family-2 protein